VAQSERILEIGCGLGLASLVGHRRGADVTASDCHPLAAEFLRENLRLNDLAPLKYRHGQWGLPDNTALPSQCGATAPHPVTGEFDLIMGSDVLYERDEEGGLAHFIQDHAAAHAEIWIVDPHRGNRPAFNRRMSHLGFALSEERLDRLATPSEAAYRGRMLTYTR